MRTQKEIQREARSILAEFTEQYPVLASMPIRVSARMTRAGGSVRFRKGEPFEIVLSLPYFASTANDLRETVTHEAAHVVAGIRAGHGPAWKRVHRIMGGKAARCHSMSLAEGYTAKRDQPRSRVQVSCGCGCGQPMNLGPTQLKRHRAGQKYSLKGHQPRSRNDGLDGLRDMLKF